MDTSRFSLLCCVALVLCMNASLANAQEADDWSAALSSDAAQSDTGVLGMSAEELAAYTAEGDLDDIDDEVPDDFIRNRRRLVIREALFNADWDTDPTAIPAFINQFKRRLGMEAHALAPRAPINFDDPEIYHWPVLYMTAHNAFTLSEPEVDGLRKYLDRGGFVYADDCLYGWPFGKAFPGELAKVYPDKQLEILEPAHPTFGTIFRQKYSWKDVTRPGLPESVDPQNWMGITVDGNLAVLYTPQDIGCAWEISSPPTPANPLGRGMHGIDMFPNRREDSYKLGINIMLYILTH